MRAGALELRDYPTDVVLIDCAKCARSWTIPKRTLIRRYGADALLPDLKDKITGCPKAGDEGRYYDRCGAAYPELGSA